MSNTGGRASAEDFVQGVRAVDPDITIEELISLSQDKDKLESLRKGVKEIHLVVIGKTGTGKSSLINGLIGVELARVGEGLQTSGVTDSVEPYYKDIDGIKVVLYDSPGLEDGSGKEKNYLDQLYDKCNKKVDLVIFGVRMTDNRFVPDNPDARALVKFTRRFGPEIWKKAIIIITCTNICEALNPQLKKRSDEKRKAFFRQIIAAYKRAIHDTLIKKASVPPEIVEQVKVIPTGHESESQLLDGSLWFSNFWLECLTAIPTVEGRTALIKVNAQRFKSHKEVSSTDFLGPLVSQPIVIGRGNLLDDTKLPVSTVATVLIPTFIGAALGASGFAAGPVGVVGVPIGLFAGMVVGAIMAALRSELKK